MWDKQTDSLVDFHSLQQKLSKTTKRLVKRILLTKNQMNNCNTSWDWLTVQEEQSEEHTVEKDSSEVDFTDFFALPTNTMLKMEHT